MSKEKPRLGFNLFMTSMHFLQRYFSPILSNHILNYQRNFIFYFVTQQSINLIWVVFFVAQVGANHTFYLQDVQEVTSTFDLVIANILEGLLMPRVLIPHFPIPFWDAKSNKTFLVLFLFCMQYPHDCNILLVFYLVHPK